MTKDEFIQATHWFIGDIEIFIDLGWLKVQLTQPMLTYEVRENGDGTLVIMPTKQELK